MLEIHGLTEELLHTPISVLCLLNIERLLLLLFYNWILR